LGKGYSEKYLVAVYLSITNLSLIEQVNFIVPEIVKNDYKYLVLTQRSYFYQFVYLIVFLEYFCWLTRQTISVEWRKK